MKLTIGILLVAASVAYTTINNFHLRHYHSRPHQRDHQVHTSHFFSSSSSLQATPTSVPLTVLDESSISRIFNDVDKDGSGAIDVDEMELLLKNLSISASYTETQILFNSLDEDNNGTIDFDEFSRWFKSIVSSSSIRQFEVRKFLSSYDRVDKPFELGLAGEERQQHATTQRHSPTPQPNPSLPAFTWLTIDIHSA